MLEIHMKSHVDCNTDCKVTLDDVFALLYHAVTAENTA